MGKKIKKKGFTLVELLIAISISSIIILIAYGLINSSAACLKREAQLMYSQNDISTAVEYITQDIKESKIDGSDLDYINNKYYIHKNNEDIIYEIVFFKKYGEVKLYNIHRKKGNEDLIIVNGIIENGFKIDIEDNLYTVSIDLYDKNMPINVKFNVYRMGKTASISPPEEDDMDYRGYLANIDFSKDPIGTFVPTETLINGNNFNSLSFDVINNMNGSKEVTIATDDMAAGYNIGIRSNIDEKFVNGKYSKELPYDAERNAVKAFYIKDIDKTDMEITINLNMNTIVMIELSNGEKIKFLLNYDKTNKEKYKIRYTNNHKNICNPPGHCEVIK